MNTLYRHTFYGTAWAAFCGLLTGSPRSFAMALFGWMVGTWIGIFVTEGRG